MKLSCAFCGVAYQVNPDIYPAGTEFHCTNCPNQVVVESAKVESLTSGSRGGDGFHLARVEMSASDKFDTMDSTHWGTLFPADELNILLHYFDVFRADSDQYVFREHDRDKYFCIIAEGRVEIIKEANEQESKVLARFKAGHVFGEMALIDGKPRSASAVAREPSVLFILTLKGFKELVHNEPHAAISIILKLSQVISMRLRLTSGKLVEQLVQED